jgi:flagellar hook protein FlgE
VIGNNVANASTVGFKGATANFSDLYAASLGIVGASQVGIGVGVAAIQQQFTQGNLTTTNNPLDLALNGGGFFRMSNGGDHLHAQRSVPHRQRRLRHQRPAAAPDRISGRQRMARSSPFQPVELQLSASQIAPRPRSDALSGEPQRGAQSRLPGHGPATDPFNFRQSFETYNFSTALTVFDTLGVVHNLTTYYVLNTPDPPGGEWTCTPPSTARIRNSCRAGI